MALQFHPMPLLKLSVPFNDPNWIFELKYDGFRAFAVIEHGHAQLLSRNGHPFASFADLGKQIEASVPNTIDGCLMVKLFALTIQAERSSKFARPSRQQGC